MAWSRAWCNVAVIALVSAWASGCPSSGNSKSAGEVERKRNTTFTTRDGNLTAVLPADLHVHRHGAALQGVSADGRFRVHIEHSPRERLMRAVGRTKEVLRKRVWDNVSEKHYEHAIELKLKRGGVSGRIPERRTVWWVDVGDRVVMCDGVAHKDVSHRLDAPFRALCQGITLKPLERADTPDGDVVGDATPDRPDGTHEDSRGPHDSNSR